MSSKKCKTLRILYLRSQPSNLQVDPQDRYRFGTHMRDVHQRVMTSIKPRIDTVNNRVRRNEEADYTSYTTNSPS